MRITLQTGTISPHQLPLAREIVKRVGAENYRYVFSQELSSDRKSIGWSAADEPWCISAETPEAREWIEACDVLVTSFRDCDLIERRAKSGLRTWYCNERWFKPIRFAEGLKVERLKGLKVERLMEIPGWVRMFVPGFRRMAKRFVGLVNGYEGVGILAIGPWAKRDFLRLGVREEKIVDWGYFVQTGDARADWIRMTSRDPWSLSVEEDARIVKKIEGTEEILVCLPDDDILRHFVKGYWDGEPKVMREIVEWAKGIVPSRIDNDYIGEIQTHKNALRSILFHTRFRGPLKVLILQHLETILRHAVLFNKGRDGNDVFYNLAHRMRFAAGPQGAEKEFIVRLIVKETSEGNRTWTVEFSNKEELTGVPTTGKAATVEVTRLKPPSTHTILKRIYGVNGAVRTPHSLRILWVGRDIPLKRVKDIERAVALANAKAKAFQPFNSSTFQPFNFTKLTGVKANAVRRAMREHDVFVFASDAQEGWGAVVNEALEEGMRVIGTFEAGSSAAMLPKERLYHAGDVKALAQLLEKDFRGELPPCSIGEWTAEKGAERLLRIVAP